MVHVFFSSACDVLETNVARGVDGVCVFGSGRGGKYWGEWVRGLGLGFANPAGTWGKWDMCLCFGCGGVGGVRGGGAAWARVSCYVCVCCESGFFVLIELTRSSGQKMRSRI